MKTLYILSKLFVLFLFSIIGIGVWYCAINVFDYIPIQLRSCWDIVLSIVVLIATSYGFTFTLMVITFEKIEKIYNGIKNTSK